MIELEFNIQAINLIMETFKFHWPRNNNQSNFQICNGRKGYNKSGNAYTATQEPINADENYILNKKWLREQDSNLRPKD